MSPSEEEYEAAKAALVEAGFTESQVSRILNKPKRAYTKDSNWKEEAKAIYAETGVITRSQIMSTKGFPKSSNPSQTVKRFIGWLQGQTGDDLTHDKKSDSWSVQEDLSEHVAWFIKKKRLTESQFKAKCTQRGVAVEATKSALRAKGVKFTKQGEMIA